MIKSLFVITLLTMSLLATVDDIRVKVEYSHFLWVAKKAVFSLDQQLDSTVGYAELKSAGSVSKWYMWANYFGKLSKTEAAPAVYDVAYSVSVDAKEPVVHPAVLVSSEAGKPIYYEGYSILGSCGTDEIKSVKLNNVQFNGEKTFVVSINVTCPNPAPASEEAAKNEEGHPENHHAAADAVPEDNGEANAHHEAHNGEANAHHEAQNAEAQHEAHNAEAQHEANINEAAQERRIIL